MGSKITKLIFFQFFHNKSLWFCFKSEWQFFWGFFWGILPFCKSKIGDVRIFAYFFFILTSITSETSWGQTMSLTDLNEVSKFSWRCQLSYETLFVGSVSKLEPPETTISHRVILDPPRLLNWQKSPHHLGLRDYIWRKQQVYFKKIRAYLSSNFINIF